MKKISIYSAFIILIILLQASFAPVFFSSSWTADFVLMMVMVWTYIDGFEKFLKWIVLIGIIYDLISQVPVGTHVIIFTLASYAVSFMSKRFLVEVSGNGIFTIIIFSLFASIISHEVVLLSLGGFEFIKMEMENFSRNLISLSYVMIWNFFIFFGFYFFIPRLKSFFFLK